MVVCADGFWNAELLKDWQVGDGRGEALAQYVLANARRGDLDDVIRTIVTSRAS